MKIIDLKKNHEFLDQYVALRNKYADSLLTERVDLNDTRSWLKSDSIEIKGLADGNALLGVVILYKKKDNEIAIFVREPGRGLGRKLMMEVEKIARAENIDKLWAWVKASNVPAQKLFEKMDYEKEPAEKGFKNTMHKGFMYKKSIIH